MVLHSYFIDPIVARYKFDSRDYNSLLSILRQIDRNGIILNPTDSGIGTLIKNIINNTADDDPIIDKITKIIERINDQKRIVKTKSRDAEPTCLRRVPSQTCAQVIVPEGEFTVSCPGSLSGKCGRCQSVSVPIGGEQFLDEFAIEAQKTSWNIGPDKVSTLQQDEYANKHAGSLEQNVLSEPEPARIVSQDIIRRTIWRPFFSYNKDTEIIIYDRNIGRIKNNQRTNKISLNYNFSQGLLYIIEEIINILRNTKLKIVIKTESYWENIKYYSAEEIRNHRNQIVNAIFSCISNNYDRSLVTVLLPEIDNNSGRQLTDMHHARYFHSHLVTLVSDQGLDLVKGNRNSLIKDWKLKTNIIRIEEQFCVAHVIDPDGWEAFK